VTDETVRRRYRRLLWTYPAPYRAVRGEEIVDTLVESAAPGQTRPTVREGVDLTVSGLLTRFGFGYVPGLAGGAAWAASVSLALAGGLGAFLWLSRPCCSPTAATLAPAIWPLAAALVALVPRLGRPVIGLTLIAAAALVARDLVVGSPVTAVLTTEYVVPAAFAAIALFGWRRDAPRDHRLIAGLGPPVVLVATMILGTIVPTRDVFPMSRLDGPLRTSLGSVDLLGAKMLNPLAPAWLGALVLVATITGVVMRGRADRRWVWCALLLAIPSVPLARMAFGWVANPGFRLLWYPEAMLTALAMAAGVAAGIWVAGRRPGAATGAAPGSSGALATTASVALAAAAGLAAAFWLNGEVLSDVIWYGRPTGPFRTPAPVAYAAWLLAVAAYVTVGARLARPLTSLALLITVSIPLLAQRWEYAVPPMAELAPLVLLGVIALAAMDGRTNARGRGGVVLGATVLALTAILIAVAGDAYDVRVTERIAGLAAIPYAVAAVAGGLALRMGERRPVASTVVVVAAVGGLSAVVPSTYTEYGVAVAVAVMAAAMGLVGGAVSGIRRG
jgi:hypothetical protein